MQYRLDGFRYQSLQRTAFNRHPQSGHVGNHAGVSGRNHTDFICENLSACGFNSRDCTVFPQNAGDFTVLQNIDTSSVGCAGETPGDSIVTRDAPARLKRGAQNRMSRGGRRIDNRHDLANLRRSQNIAVNPVQAIGVGAPIHISHILQVMCEIHHAALAEHDVEVQLLGERLPQNQGLFVNVSRFVPQVVGPYNRRVSAGIAAADPTLLDHRNIGDAVL